MNNKQEAKGILLIILAALGFALMNTFVKLAGDISSLQKAVFRNIVPLFISLAILIKTKPYVKLNKSSLGWLIIRSMCGTIGILCNFYAVDKLILADASMLGKLSPFFAILMSFILLKEKLSVFNIVVILSAFFGSFFILNPNFENFQLNIPVIVAITGAFFAGTAYTVVRKLGSCGVSGNFIVFFFSAFSTLCLLPNFLLNFTPMSAKQLLFLLFAGLCATIAQFAITNAYIFAPAKRISVYDYTQVIFATILGFIIYREIPGANSIIGYAIIISMGILNYLVNRNKS